MLRNLLMWLVCLMMAALPASAQETVDWAEQEALALVEQVRMLAGDSQWRTLIGATGEQIAAELDGFAATQTRKVARRYALTEDWFQQMLAQEQVTLSPEIREQMWLRMCMGIGSMLGGGLGAYHVAAQTVAAVQVSRPLPEGQAAGLLLMDCGEDWCALVTLLPRETGTLEEQAVFLHRSAAEVAEQLDEIGIREKLVE